MWCGVIKLPVAAMVANPLQGERQPMDAVASSLNYQRVQRKKYYLPCVYFRCSLIGFGWKILFLSIL